MSASPMVREWTMCSRCGEVKDRCVYVTVKTVRGGYQMVELCGECLVGLSYLLEDTQEADA